MPFFVDKDTGIRRDSGAGQLACCQSLLKVGSFIGRCINWLSCFLAIPYYYMRYKWFESQRESHRQAADTYIKEAPTLGTGRAYYDKKRIICTITMITNNFFYNSEKFQ